jgi:hypothetical protein
MRVKKRISGRDILLFLRVGGGPSAVQSGGDAAMYACGDPGSVDKVVISAQTTPVALNICRLLSL